MSEMDVIRAFLDGAECTEAALRTNGKQLFSAGCLIAERHGGKLHVMETVTGPVDPEHRALLLDFVEWREQRAKVLRKLLFNPKQMLASARTNEARASRAHSEPARPEGGA